MSEFLVFSVLTSIIVCLFWLNKWGKQLVDSTQNQNLDPIRNSGVYRNKRGQFKAK